MSENIEKSSHNTLLSSSVHSLVETDEQFIMEKKKHVILRIQALNEEIEKHDNIYDKINLQLKIVKKQHLLQKHKTDNKNA